MGITTKPGRRTGRPAHAGEPLTGVRVNVPQIVLDLLEEDYAHIAPKKPNTQIRLVLFNYLYHNIPHGSGADEFVRRCEAILALLRTTYSVGELLDDDSAIRAVQDAILDARAAPTDPGVRGNAITAVRDAIATASPATFDLPTARAAIQATYFADAIAASDDLPSDRMMYAAALFAASVPVTADPAFRKMSDLILTALDLPTDDPRMIRKMATSFLAAIEAAEDAFATGGAQGQETPPEASSKAPMERATKEVAA